MSGSRVSVPEYGDEEGSVAVALFPGQGVQSPGMGTGLIEVAPEVFDAASDVLGVDVIELCREGRSGAAELSSTRWAQPAVLVCGVAAFNALTKRGRSFLAVAGHSVGEYAALVAAESLDLTDALRLVAERAEATDDASRATPGAMAAVMRAERDAVEGICAANGVTIAADNAPGQLVISGPTDGVARAIEAAEAAGAVCRRLDVSGAFHSPCMAGASDRLAAALERTPFAEPRIEVWSSTTAQPVRKADEIRAALRDQLTAPVRWRETVAGIARRFGSVFCDLGPGHVVAALARRIVRGAEVRTVDELLVAEAGGGR